MLFSLHVSLLVKSENAQPLVPVTDTPVFCDTCFSLIKNMNEEVIKGCRTPANNVPSAKNISDKRSSILMYYVRLPSFVLCPHSLSPDMSA